MRTDDYVNVSLRIPRKLHEWYRRQHFERRVSLNYLLTEAALKAVPKKEREELRNGK